MKLIADVLKAVAGLAAAVASAPAVHATPITYTFEGSVDWDDAERGWSGYTGSFTFDSTAVDTIADPQTAAYAHAGAPWGLSVTFDGTDTVSLADVFHLLVTDGLGGSDQLGALAQDAAGTEFLSLTLWDFSQAVFSSDALPLPAGGLSSADFQWGGFSYETAAGTLQGSIDAFGCIAGCTGAVANPVPEPGSGALVLAGLSVLATLQRRRGAPVDTIGA